MVCAFYCAKAEVAYANYAFPACEAKGSLCTIREWESLLCTGNMRGWRADKLRRFPELHFTYEEEASPEDFFVPYVWTQVGALLAITLSQTPAFSLSSHALFLSHGISAVPSSFRAHFSARTEVAVLLCATLVLSPGTKKNSSVNQCEACDQGEHNRAE
jgi:hypothetical protein